MQDLLDAEMEFAMGIQNLNSLFEYLNSTLYQQYVENMTNQAVKGKNKTIRELLNSLKEKSLNSFESLKKLNKEEKEKKIPVSDYLRSFLHIRRGSDWSADISRNILHETREMSDL